MKLYITGRCGGKTTHMVKWLKEDNNRIIITFSIDEAQRIIKHFKLDGFTASHVMSLQQYMMQPAYLQDIGIDNADIVLETVLKSKIELISITEEEE